MLNSRIYAIVFAVIVLCSAHFAIAHEWADLTMTFLMQGSSDGIAPSMVVDKDTKAIANVVFMVDTRRMDLTPEQIHPDLRDVPKSNCVLKCVKKEFVPHVIALRAGQSIEVQNRDAKVLSVIPCFFENPIINVTVDPGNKAFIPTQFPEKAPSKFESTIYPRMSAFAFVLDHPYIGISDTSGVIKIEKLPANIPLTFRLWHENSDKSIDEVKLGDKTQFWHRGSVTLTLQEGMNDLGNVIIDRKRFRK